MLYGKVFLVPYEDKAIKCIKNGFSQAERCDILINAKYRTCIQTDLL